MLVLFNHPPSDFSEAALGIGATSRRDVGMAKREGKCVKTPVALTVAGSDSGGGAGVQADLKTFAALGVYGLSAITALTAQNTAEVTRVLDVPADMVAAQIDAVLGDFGAQAAKTGMLASALIVKVVAERLAAHGVTNLVVDPVMVAKSGTLLLREDGIAALKRLLLPLAIVVTPNIPEAEVLTGRKIVGREDLYDAAREILAMGSRNVVLKGGHAEGDAVDIFYDGKDWREYSAARLLTPHTHGTGCTFSAAIAAFLARGYGVEEAVTAAKGFITNAIRHGLPLGHGHGPVNQFPWVS